MRRHSPYNYAFNNPVFFIDPDGMQAEHCPTCPNTLEFKSYIDDQNKTYQYDEVDNAAYEVLDEEIALAEVNLISPKSESSGFLDLPEYIKQAYGNSYDPRFSPYNPDAVSLNFGFGANTIMAHYDVSISIIIAPGEIAGGLNYSGGIGFSGLSPSFGPYGSVGFHDKYGTTTDVIDGMQGKALNTNTTLGPLNTNYSQSATDNGVYSSRGGTRSVSIGLGKPGLGVSQQFSNSIIWRPFKK